jgi:hypothetical protein
LLSSRILEHPRASGPESSSGPGSEPDPRDET